MGEFVCRVVDARGQVSSLVELAETEAELRQRLAGKGFFIYSVRSRALPQLALRRPAARRRLPASEFLLFNQQFVTLIRAGLPILQALDLLAERAARPALRGVLDDVRQRVRGGASLSDAFKAQALFPEVYTTAVLAGERSGNLAGVLEQYVSYQKVTGSVKRRLLTALVYPALLVVVSAAVLTGVILFVIPRFNQLYTEMGSALPAPTQFVISFALQIRDIAAVAALLLPVVVAAAVAFGRTPAGAQALDQLRMRLPLVGDILLKFRLTQFCRTLATLLGGGIPAVPSLEVAAGAMDSPVLREAIRTAAQGVREGQSLNKALRATGVVPEMVTEMIEVGEATGALAAMLNSVAEFYEEDLSARLGTLIALVEPALLLLVGTTVLLILVALYLPIFSVGTLVH